MIFWSLVHFDKVHDLKWILKVIFVVFKLYQGLQTLSSIFSKVGQMEFEHYSIQPTKYRNDPEFWD